MGELGAGFAALALEIDGGSGEGDEARRAEMRDPAGDEERGPGLRRIDGVDGVAAEVVAGVIERHEDHEQAAQEVDGFDAAAGGNAGDGAAGCDGGAEDGAEDKAEDGSWAWHESDSVGNWTAGPKSDSWLWASGYGRGRGGDLGRRGLPAGAGRSSRG